MVLKPTIHHIPVCPFSQRLEILLTLKGVRDQITFSVVDITKPRPERLLQLTGGTTALPILETADGTLKESLVILRYLDESYATPIARSTPFERAIENMMIALEGDFTASGYRLVMNQDAGKREALHQAVLTQYGRLEAFLARHNPDGVFLFERFGLAEAVFTPMFVRFSFLDYFEAFELADQGYGRVKRRQLLSSELVAPPSTTLRAVPLPRKRERLPCGKVVPHRRPLPLAGEGDRRQAVEGGAARAMADRTAAGLVSTSSIEKRTTWMPLSSRKAVRRSSCVFRSSWTGPSTSIANFRAAQ